MYDNIIKDKIILKRVAKLQKQGLFDALDFNYIREVKRKKFPLKFIINGEKILINDKEQFKDFLDVVEQNYLSDPVKRSEIFKSSKKERLIRSR